MEPPGTSKSSFSTPLVNELGCAYLEIDCVGDPFTLDRDQNYITNLEPPLIQGLINLAKSNLEKGQTVLLDLPWKHLVINNPDLLAQFRAMANEQKIMAAIFN